MTARLRGKGPCRSRSGPEARPRWLLACSGRWLKGRGRRISKRPLAAVHFAPSWRRGIRKFGLARPPARAGRVLGRVTPLPRKAAQHVQLVLDRVSQSFSSTMMALARRGPQGIYGILQYLAESLDQADEVANIAALLIALELEQDRHDAVGIVFGGMQVHRKMQRQMRHFCKRDVFADHVVIDRAAIELFQRIAPRGDARVNAVPAFRIAVFFRSLR